MKDFGRLRGQTVENPAMDEALFRGVVENNNRAKENFLRTIASLVTPIKLMFIGERYV